ncbi:GntR family transcriptional regulator [Clostridiaceae bacterium]|nr:GntR family transcriptional regulator [Clostridiaceae bacterium]MDE7036329.1 GntR family transcriptional regulator [Eubacteriales bacterium]NBH80066.1 GntR family transcriptional regulator [Clostridiaceae bacterium]NBI81124.1 GntR family transcriptional regulator [Clostridiaceae bacterium]RKJ82013.1 GntR family transcriptional regulator [Butyricicoccus sp. 1XD8-22]
MNLIISNAAGQPIYEQIYTQLKQLILSGELHEGDALPSMRVLAKELRISVITTKRAYEELERDGFLVTVAGKGCFVAGMDRELVREEHLRRIEEHFGEAARLAKSAGVSRAEVMEILETVCEGEGL